MDKRVKFDFEIEFTNGGGIQGQDFRLDIAGDTISDKQLADFIVQDMRLLMVGEVRILNKEIILENHKRKPINTHQGHSAIIELSDRDRPDHLQRVSDTHYLRLFEQKRV